MQDAEALYRRVLAFDPNSSDARYGLGFTLENSSRTQRAEAEYRRAIELEPERAPFRLALAGLAHRMGRLATAVAEYDAVLALDPGSPAVRNNLAWLLASAADPAIQDLPRALSLARRACEQTGWRDLHILETLCRIHLLNGDLAGATRELRAAAVRHRSGGDEGLAAAVEERLAAYREAESKLKNMENMPRRGN